MNISQKSILWVIPVIALLFYLISWPWDGWLSETMPRHQVIQLPAMFLLGVIPGVFFSKIRIKDTAAGIAAFIFVMSSLIFWMLPRSVDMAVLWRPINRAMHVNMVVAGFLSVVTFRGIIFEIKIVFLGMISAMLLVTGLTLRVYNMLLCSAFNIFEQRETGTYMIIIGAGLFVANVVFFFATLSRDNLDEEPTD